MKTLAKNCQRTGGSGLGVAVEQVWPVILHAVLDCWCTRRLEFLRVAGATSKDLKSMPRGARPEAASRGQVIAILGPSWASRRRVEWWHDFATHRAEKRLSLRLSLVPLSPPALIAGALLIPLRNCRSEVVAHTLIDEQDAHLARMTWHLKSDGYAARWEKRQVRPNGTSRGRIVRLHRVILGAPPGVEVDHINRNRLDNRRSNLRLATDGENARNCKRNTKNTSGYKGVRVDDRVHRWGASVVLNGKAYWMGLFDTPKQAAFAYDFAATALHGEFAATNFQLSKATKDHAREFRAFLIAGRAGESAGAAR